MNGRARFLVGASAGALLLSLTGYVLMVRAAPVPLWTLPDTTVYRDAGLALLHHSGVLYTAKFGSPPLDYLYTPFAALGLAGFGPLPFGVWKFGLTGLGIGLVWYVCYASLGLPGVERGWRRLAGSLALASVALWLEPVQRTLSFGQINLVLLALVVFDLALPDGKRWKGVAIGIAAGIKLTPLIFVAYLFLSRRRRAGFVSLASFVATALLGFVFAWRDSSAYWLHGKLVRSDVITNVLVNQSLQGFAGRLVHGSSSSRVLYDVLALVVGAVGLWTAAVASRRGDELLGLVLCGVTGLLVSPVSWTHHWVFVVPALVLVVERRDAVWLRSPRVRLGFGAGLLALFIAWPVRLRLTGGWSAQVPWSDGGLLRYQAHGFGAELHWNALELVLGDYYVLAGVLFVGSAGVALLILGAFSGVTPSAPALPGGHPVTHDPSLSRGYVANPK